MENNKKNHELVILTSVDSRVSNLPIIFESIKKNALGRDGVHVTWALCHDVNKSSKDDINYISDFIKYISLTSNLNYMGWAYVPIYKDKDSTNYGGTMFNPAVKYIIESFYGGRDPWFYILDIDNTLTEMFGELISDMIATAVDKGADIIHTNIKYSCGTCAPVLSYHTGILPKNSINNEAPVTPWPLKFDPSQIIINYRFLDKIGLYPEGYNYDWVLHFNIMDNLDKVVFQNDYDKLYGSKLSMWTTTHNSIPTKEKIKDIISMLDSNDAKDCVVTICDRKHGSMSLHIRPDIARKIIDENFDYE